MICLNLEIFYYFLLYIVFSLSSCTKDGQLINSITNANYKVVAYYDMGADVTAVPYVWVSYIDSNSFFQTENEFIRLIKWYRNVDLYLNSNNILNVIAFYDVHTNDSYHFLVNLDCNIEKLKFYKDYYELKLNEFIKTIETENFKFNLAKLSNKNHVFHIFLQNKGNFIVKENIYIVNASKVELSEYNENHMKLNIIWICEEKESEYIFSFKDNRFIFKD